MATDYSNPSRFPQGIRTKSLNEQARQFDASQSLQDELLDLQREQMELDEIFRNRVFDTEMAERQKARDAAIAEQAQQLAMQREQEAQNRRMASVARIEAAKGRLAPDPIRSRMNTAMSLSEDVSRATNPMDVAGNAWRTNTAGLAALGITSGARGAGASAPGGGNALASRQLDIAEGQGNAAAEAQARAAELAERQFELGARQYGNALDLATDGGARSINRINTSGGAAMPTGASSPIIQDSGGSIQLAGRDLVSHDGKQEEIDRAARAAYLKAMYNENPNAIRALLLREGLR